MAAVKISLEQKLKALQGPEMPPDVEERVRGRVMDELSANGPDRSVRRVAKASPAQIALLVVLLITAGWVVRRVGPADQPASTLRTT